MLCREHSSSESSSESETGIYTCDEGREADDEQSDWFAEPDPVYGVPGAPNPNRQRNPSNRLSWWNDEFGLSLSAKVVCQPLLGDGGVLMGRLSVQALWVLFLYRHNIDFRSIVQ